MYFSAICFEIYVCIQIILLPYVCNPYNKLKGGGSKMLLIKGHVEHHFENGEILIVWW